MSGPCGQDDRSVVLGQLLVGPLDPGLVAARDADCGAKLIRDHCSGHPAQVLEGSHVARDPVVALLRPARLGEGEARGAEHCDEQLRLPHLADLGVDHPRMLPGVVDEQLLPRAVHLPHRSALRADPAPIPLAELRVTVSVGMALEVLVMQQLQRHARAAKLSVEVAEVRRGPIARRQLIPAVQPPVELHLAHRRHRGPAQLRRDRSLQRQAHRAEPHA